MKFVCNWCKESKSEEDVAVSFGWPNCYCNDCVDFEESNHRFDISGQLEIVLKTERKKK